ncbi:MAG TPA: formylglycine-generating enzyme family protein [Phycisphaerae bacterium]|nr:formylglycine-generating enzyme family protein [Phycisphaerae bacterium]
MGEKANVAGGQGRRETAVNLAKALLVLSILTIATILPNGAGSSAPPTTQPSTQPTSLPASTPSPQHLEQARDVFRQLMVYELTDGDRARIEKLIAQLGSDSWKDREEAEKALTNESAAALPLIRQACDDRNPEITRRAGRVVEVLQARKPSAAKKLRWAIGHRHAAGDTAVVGELIALLDSDEPAVGYIAGRGLLRLTGQDFGYAAYAEPTKRKQAAQKAREWWKRNKAAFVLQAPVGPEEEIFLDLGGGVSVKLVLIPAGKFMMGSPVSEKGRQRDEGPQREVTISRPFYMGVYEVTQEQYQAVMGKNPSAFKGAKNPVELVSWNDATEFCKKLSTRTGRTVGLPTEAQWEYACRAESKTQYHFGEKDEDLGDYAWYLKNSNGETHSVGGKKPNAFGLYDMHGNVWEWCSDWHAAYANAKKVDPSGPASGEERVLRGGSWNLNPQICRSASRLRSTPGNRDGTFGFRVAVDLK